MSNALRPAEARSTRRRPPRPMLAQSRSLVMPRVRQACASRSRNRLKSECMVGMCGTGQEMQGYGAPLHGSAKRITLGFGLESHPITQMQGDRPNSGCMNDVNAHRDPECLPWATPRPNAMINLSPLFSLMSMTSPIPQFEVCRAFQTVVQRLHKQLLLSYAALCSYEPKLENKLRDDPDRYGTLTDTETSSPNSFAASRPQPSPACPFSRQKRSRRGGTVRGAVRVEDSGEAARLFQS